MLWLQASPGGHLGPPCDPRNQDPCPSTFLSHPGEMQIGFYHFQQKTESKSPKQGVVLLMEGSGDILQASPGWGGRKLYSGAQSDTVPKKMSGRRTKTQVGTQKSHQSSIFLYVCIHFQCSSSLRSRNVKNPLILPHQARTSDLSGVKHHGLDLHYTSGEGLWLQLGKILSHRGAATFISTPLLKALGHLSVSKIYLFYLAALN